MSRRRYRVNSSKDCTGHEGRDYQLLVVPQRFGDLSGIVGMDLRFGDEVFGATIRCSWEFVLDAALKVVMSVSMCWISGAMLAISNSVLLVNFVERAVRDGRAFWEKGLSWDALSVVVLIASGRLTTAASKFWLSEVRVFEVWSSPRRRPGAGYWSEDGPEKQEMVVGRKGLRVTKMSRISGASTVRRFTMTILPIFRPLRLFDCNSRRCSWHRNRLSQSLKLEISVERRCHFCLLSGQFEALLLRSIARREPVDCLMLMLISSAMENR